MAQFLQNTRGPTVPLTLVINKNECPIKFWHANSNRMPELYRISTRYLCIQATSVPCERTSSQAGHLTNEKRNRRKLNSKNLNKIMTLGGLPCHLISKIDTVNYFITR